MLCIIVCQGSEKDKKNLNLGERRERLMKADNGVWRAVTSRVQRESRGEGTGQDTFV